MSRADQSLSGSTPNTWSANASTATRSPRVEGAPTTKPSSHSMSRRRLSPYSGVGFPDVEPVETSRCPHGRRTGVPETTTVPARPW
jgi:hypothetical protein